MKNSLARLLAETEAPVFALDARRAIVFCNPALADWLSVDSARLLGRAADYLAPAGDDPADRAAAAIAPRPEALTGELTEATVERCDADGRTLRRRVRYLRLPWRDECRLVGVLATEDRVEDGAEESGAAVDEAAELHRRLLALQDRIQACFRTERALGDGPVSRRIHEQLRIAIDSRARTLIVGPPGSGREHLARSIHVGNGPDRPGPLLPLVCNLLDSELLEAALHGFLRQASTVDPTVLLLDADLLPSEAQATLARILSAARRPPRTLATARRPLPQLAAEGTYRVDLAAWLSPLVVELPPLVERRDEIPLLAQRALEACNAGAERQSSGFKPDALDALCAYAWPENLDELHAVVREAFRRATGPQIALADLPETVRRAAETKRPERPVESMKLDELLADVEREAIVRALRASKGNKARAARLLGVARARLLRRIEQLGLE